MGHRMMPIGCCLRVSTALIRGLLWGFPWRPWKSTREGFGHTAGVERTGVTSSRGTWILDDDLVTCDKRRPHVIVVPAAGFAPFPRFST